MGQKSIDAPVQNEAAQVPVKVAQAQAEVKNETADLLGKDQTLAKTGPVEVVKAEEVDLLGDAVVIGGKVGGEIVVVGEGETVVVIGEGGEVVE